MFDRDKWLEIFYTILQNPLRTFLTGVSVSLGIFILVVMQGLGFGMEKGVMRQMQNAAVNSIWVRSGTTSLPFRGRNPGRNISYSSSDLNYVVENVEGIGVYTPLIGFWGSPMSYGQYNMNYTVRGIFPAYQELRQVDIKSGRYINQADVDAGRKVVVLGQNIVDDLFRGKEPLGEFMTIRGVQFAVVGTFEDPNSRWENRAAYIPASTAQRLFERSERISMFVLSTGDAPFRRTQEMVVEVEQFLQDKYAVHPRDKRAIRITNNNEDFRTYMNIFLGIRIFIWVIGGFTLLAGMIGVGNIMSIVVKERTKEIGIRKALGATPITILSLIIQEAVFLTLVAGSVGLIAGVALLELGGDLLDHEFFANPEVDFTICAISLGLLVVSGVFSGLFPALRAVAVSPVEALRTE